MKTIAEYEEIYKQKDSAAYEGISNELYWGYFKSRRAGADEINLDDIKWERDIEPLLNDCHRFGIECITISSTWSGAMNIVWGLVKRGCTVEGMKEVQMDSEDWDALTNTWVQQKKPALIIKIA